MNKHILCINGSPRKNGKVAQMLHCISTELEQNGCTVTFINSSDLAVKPCAGCMQCRSTNTCILPHDDAHKFASLLEQTDAIVVGSPVYWGNISGQLKILFDRVVPVMMGETKSGFPLPRQKGKKALLVVCCNTVPIGDFFAGESRGALRALKEILSYSGYRICGKLVFAGTKGKAELPSKIQRKAVAIARRLM